MEVLYLTSNILRQETIIEALATRQMLFITKRFVSSGASTYMVYTHVALEKMSALNVIKLFKIFNKDSSDTKFLKTIDISLQEYIRISNLKYKTKNELLFLIKMKKKIREMKNYIHRYCAYINRKERLENFEYFCTKDKLIYNSNTFQFKDEKSESEIITFLKETFTKYFEVFLIESSIEKLYPSISNADEAKTVLDESNEYDFFIKLKLADFPPLWNLSIEQIEYTSNNLKETMNEFDKERIEFYQQIENLAFSRTNAENFFNIYNSTLGKAVEKLQQNLDKELYIQQARNSNNPDTHIRLNIIITSIENLVNYYKAVNIIGEYEADSLMKHLERTYKPKQAYIALYNNFIYEGDFKETYFAFSKINLTKEI